MGKQAPAAPDYKGFAQQQAGASKSNVNAQTTANRPDQSSPFASSTWSQGPNGEWRQSTSLNGPLAGAAAGAGQQAATAMGQPLDLSSLPQLDYGQQAGQGAYDAAYGQATSRLDPEWGKREEAQRTQLLNQGLDPSSEAYRNASAELSRDRNDAYGSARNAAFGQGQQAQQQAFGQSLMARQGAMVEALRKRGLPLEELHALQGLTGQAGFQGAGLAETPQLLPAAMGQYGAEYQRYRDQMRDQADMLGGLTSGLGKAASIPFGFA